MKLVDKSQASPVTSQYMFNLSNPAGLIAISNTDP